MWRLSIVCLGLALLFGCRALREAREAQAELRVKGEAVAVPAAEKVDFRAASLRDLVDFAMTNRPSVIAARLAVDDARLALKSLRADAPVLSDSPWTAPKLSLGGGYAESSQQLTWDEHDWRTLGGPSAGLSLDLLVYDFGRYAAKERAQAESVVAAEQALAETGYTVFFEVSDAYFAFLESSALLDVALTNEFQYAEHLRWTEARVGAGEAQRLDLLKARFDLAKSRQATVAASNRVDTAGATLMNALGVEASRGTSREAFGDGAVRADEVRRGFARTDYDVSAAFALARTNAPAMRIARARLRAASSSVDAAIADLRPSLSLSASLNWADPLWFWQWGASAAQTLFQGFRKTTAVDRSVVAMRQAAAVVDETEQELSKLLETAIANRDNSMSAIESAMASLKSARENLETVREQWKVGGASRIDLSDAMAGLSQASGDAITAFYDGQRAEAKLFALVGAYPVYREEIVRGGK